MTSTLALSTWRPVHLPRGSAHPTTTTPHALTRRGLIAGDLSGINCAPFFAFALSTSVHRQPKRQRCATWTIYCSSSGLSSKRCEPCEQELQPEACGFMGLNGIMKRDDAQYLLDTDDELSGWLLNTDENGVLMLHKTLRTQNFKSGLELFTLIGAIAEEEGHHPDLHLVSWNRVSVNISTHAIGGLSENDFILAAKINELDIQSLLSKEQ